ncbi:MAG: DUF29 family protein [Alphaproteobacteria bacterium]|nr:DUF29 family protein [Alphaproteobacteria bacterium]
MPEGTTLAGQALDDPFAWALDQAALLRRGAALAVSGRGALGDFLEAWAAELLATVRSQIVNLLAHAAKVATTRNPGVIGHWRSECVEFHDKLVDLYRPSMRDKIDLDMLWRRAQRKAFASFEDHGEPRPRLPARCPIALDDLLEEALDLDRLVDSFRN